jgi:hypothetical protein
MKHSIYSLVLTFSLVIINNTFAAQNPEKDSLTSKPVCLEILGIAVGQNKLPIDGVEVRLFKENEELEWNEITSVVYHEHSFVFKLEADQYYTIEISKPGYIKRLVGVSTKLPSNVSCKELFYHEFEITLVKEKTGLDDYYLDFPIALIRYDAKREVFDNNYSYTRHIKTKINESANVYNNSKTK